MIDLRVLNLNIMHGRNARSSVFPPFSSRHTVRETLDRITRVIERHEPDVVTLQEVDGFSLFNGRINHLDALEPRTPYPYRFLADNWRIGLPGIAVHRTGVALLSRHPLERVQAFDFKRSFPTPRKGFCAAVVRKPGTPPVTVASVHMVWIDWLRRDSRLQQARTLIDALRCYPTPLIVAGDFNCRLVDTSETTLPMVMHELSLDAYEPQSRQMDTWPSWKPTERDDWVLISRGCRFVKHETFNDRHSDHLAVYATVGLPG